MTSKTRNPAFPVIARSFEVIMGDEAIPVSSKATNTVSRRGAGSAEKTRHIGKIPVATKAMFFTTENSEDTEKT